MIRREGTAIADVETTGLMFNGDGAEIHECADMAVVGITIICGDRNVGGPAVERGDTAVCSATIVEILVANIDVSVIRRRDGQSGANAIALEVHEIAEAVGTFVHA